MAFQTGSSAQGFSPLSINKPSGTATGNTLLAFAICRATASTVPPDGTWVQQGGILENASNGVHLTVWKKTAASEPSSYTWTVSGENQGYTIVIVRDDTTGSTAGYATTTGGGSTWTAPSVTPSLTPGTFYAIMGAGGGSGSFANTPPAGYTACGAASVDQGGGSSDNCCVAVFAKAYVGLSASGTPSINTGLGLGYISAQLAMQDLQPSGGSQVVLT